MAPSCGPFACSTPGPYVPAFAGDGDAVGFVVGVCPSGCVASAPLALTSPSGAVPDVGDLRSLYSDAEWDALTVAQRQAALDRARSGQRVQDDARRTVGYVQTGANALRDLLAFARGAIQDNQSHLQAQARNANAADASRRADENAARATELASVLASLRVAAGQDASPETATTMAALQRTIDELRAAGSVSIGTAVAVGAGVLGLGTVLYLATRPRGPARNPAGCCGARKLFRKVFGNPPARPSRFVRPLGHRRGCACAVCEGQR